MPDFTEETPVRLTRALLNDSAFCARRDAVVRAWALACPAQAKAMDACLRALEQRSLWEDAANLRYLACTAPDACYAALFGTLRFFRVSALRVRGARYLASVLQRIYLPGESALSADGRGPYTTFFHECAHAIDYNFGRGPVHFLDALPQAAYTNRFRWQGHNLQFWLRRDVSAHLLRTARRFTGGDAAQAALLCKSLLRGGSEKTLREALMPFDKREALLALREKLLAHYRSVICQGAVNEAASDIFGGVTDNRVTGASFNHGAGAKWYTVNHWYWYLPFGIETQAQSRELFAEYFSYCITRNDAAVRSVRRNFPSAARCMDALLESMRAAFAAVPR